MSMLKKAAFLSQAENKERFFKRVATLFPTLDPRYQVIKKAYNVSKDAFRGKIREGGERYFEHLRAVALILIVHLRVKDHNLIIAALLHDIVEDVPSWTIQRVQSEFGSDVALLVEWMTKPPSDQFESKNERNKFYHGRFKLAPRDFFLIKLSDRLHNIMTLSSCPQEKRGRKIEETKKYYMPFAEEHLILLHELEEAMADIENLPSN